MFKSIKIKLKIPVLMAMSCLLVLSNSIAGATTLTENICKKAKLTLAQSRSTCLLKAQMTSPTLTIGPAAKTKCENTFDQRINKLDQLISSTGTACRFINKGNGTVLDLNTLLIWETKNEPDGIPSSTDLKDIDNTFSWPEATTSYLTTLNQTQGGFCSETTPLTCNKPGFAEKQDWRLPTINELAILYRCDLTLGGQCQGLDADEANSRLRIAPLGHLWSGTSDSSRTGESYRAWGVFFNDAGIGAIINTEVISTPQSVLAVRGGRN